LRVTTAYICSLPLASRRIRKRKPQRPRPRALRRRSRPPKERPAYGLVKLRGPRGRATMF